MKLYRRILGAFRTVRARSVEVGQPGLSLWTNVGESAAVQLATCVRDGAHRAETRALAIAERIDGIVADGEVTVAEVAELKRLKGSASRVAEECHDLGEVVS